jgi:hypothetical protein
MSSVCTVEVGAIGMLRAAISASASKDWLTVIIMSSVCTVEVGAIGMLRAEISASASNDWLTVACVAVDAALFSRLGWVRPCDNTDGGGATCRDARFGAAFSLAENLRAERITNLVDSPTALHSRVFILVGSSPSTNRYTRTRC